ncbi:MAG TPA: mechanosensitive ion channel domain-containing protein [Thermoanaerobaculia bacterium]|nr:mechanosensitive ion channel domain-containing protein [Thermoanaerobaculia bacterium]
MASLVSTDPAELFGVRLVGFTADNAKKLLLSVACIAAALILARLLLFAADRIFGERERPLFWSRQAIHLATLALVLIATVSIWFSDPARLTTFAGLLSAGIAFALQKVVTAFAAYFVILRGKTFRVGDRITMGGVRGDVIALGFIRTSIMEMGQPPSGQDANEAVWITSRQYTGRIVTVTNDKIFDTPVYNFTRDFPYIWEEIKLPVSYRDDRAAAEKILLDAAERHTLRIRELGEEALRALEKRFFMRRTEMGPRVYWRITDNWLELTVRFLVEDHGVREVKDKMSRDILAALDAQGIGIASGTYEVVGMPPLEVKLAEK